MKKYFRKIVFGFILALIFVLLFLIYYFVWRIPTSQEIFENSQHSVVELKSQTGEDIISYGSAIFIDKDGTLVSNAHMVAYKRSGIYKEFETFQIRFCFETEYRKVLLIKYDLSQDISLFKLEDIVNVPIKPIKIKENENISSGDRVYAVGNGMNHGVSITQGIVSLPQVNIEYEENIRSVIQCDLIINEGNSGGALLDAKGSLIGITTFRLKDNYGNIIYGIAFCIPINIVMNFYNTIN